MSEPINTGTLGGGATIGQKPAMTPDQILPMVEYYCDSVNQTIGNLAALPPHLFAIFANALAANIISSLMSILLQTASPESCSKILVDTIQQIVYLTNLKMGEDEKSFSPELFEKLSDILGDAFNNYKDIIDELNAATDVAREREKRKSSDIITPGEKKIILPR